MLNSKVKGYLSALFATMFMGSLGVFVKNLQTAPTVITLFRLSIAALLILLLIIAKHNIKELRILPSKNLAISGFALSASVIFYVIAIQRTSMSNAVFLLYLGPVFASFAAFLFLKESLSGIDILSLILSIFGLLFMFRFNFHFQNIDILGTVCGLLAGLSYGMIIFFNRIIKSNVSLDVRSFYQFTFGSLIVLPFAIKDFNIIAVEHDLFMLIAMAVVCGFMGITLMFNAIKHLPAIEYGVLSYLEMFFATTFGILAFGENLGIFKIAGGSMILASGMLQVFKNKIKKVLT
jgi:drug/metabolite transporter (DMT)-like permease